MSEPLIMTTKETTGAMNKRKKAHGKPRFKKQHNVNKTTQTIL